MSLEPNSAGDRPRIDAAACVHPSAVIIGNVQIGPNVYIGPRAVIRADEPGPDGTVSPIVIGPEANVQDGVILHAFGGTCVTIGPGTSLAHGAVVHGPCETGSGSFIGFNSVICNVTLGKSVIVMHSSVVEGVSVPDGLYISSLTSVCSQANVLLLRPASAETLEFVARVRHMNIRLAAAGGIAKVCQHKRPDHLSGMS